VRGARADLRPLPEEGRCGAWKRADILVWDPSTPSTLTLESINDALDWSPYDGLDIPGTLRHVLARGDRAVEDGRWLDADHRGEYLPVRRVAAPM
jgi:dihydropyrimidinase